MDDFSNSEDPAQSKLMQDAEKQEERQQNGTTWMNMKFDIYVKRHSFREKGQATVKVYRTDMRRCLLIVIAAVLVLSLVAALAFLIIYFTVLQRREPDGGASVVTSLGSIHGHVIQAPQGGAVEEYLGIPFAKPPVGDLRYADPEPPGKFPNGSYSATDIKYACVQYLDQTYKGFIGTEMWNAQNPLSEDCLYLNVWSPKPRKKGRTVMVWIYGGGYYSGANSLWTYNGTALAAHTDVIVVSLNYRLGSFGYLSTGDGRIKGNFGMKDQVMALKWVKDNIDAFGGDPASVTLFGESAGAASIGLHQLSDLSKDLFVRAVYQSGAPDAHLLFMSPEQARERSKIFFQNVGCPDDSKVLQCLRRLNDTTILNNEWVDTNFIVFPWVPNVDGDYLTDTPYNLLKAGKFAKKDTILGSNKDEGTFWILFSVKGLNKDTESLLTYKQYLDGVDVICHDISNATKQQVISLYSPQNRSDMAGNRDALDKVCGDRSFTCPTRTTAEIFTSGGARTYFYYLSYRASNEVWPPWMGVIHGADISWVFGMPLDPARGYNEKDVQLAKSVMDYWANFAKTGNPNGPGLTEWPLYKADSKQILEMRDPDEFVLRNTLRDKYCQFWNRLHRESNGDS